MKKNVGILLLILFLFTSGCKNVQTKNSLQSDNTSVSTKSLENNRMMAVVEKYNESVFRNDWEVVRENLTGRALKNFELNSKKYANNTVFISQKNSVETGSEEFGIIKSSVDFEIIQASGERVLSREWFQFLLVKEEIWKIAKLDEIRPDLSMNSNISQEESSIFKILENFLRLSSQGKILEASKYLTGKNLLNAEKYKLSSMPQNTFQKNEIKILGMNKDECIARAKYQINGKSNDAIFHMVKIKGVWLINEQL